MVAIHGYITSIGLTPLSFMYPIAGQPLWFSAHPPVLSCVSHQGLQKVLKYRHCIQSIRIPAVGVNFCYTTFFSAVTNSIAVTMCIAWIFLHCVLPLWNWLTTVSLHVLQWRNLNNCVTRKGHEDKLIVTVLIHVSSDCYEVTQAKRIHSKSYNLVDVYHWFCL